MQNGTWSVVALSLCVGLALEPSRSAGQTVEAPPEDSMVLVPAGEFTMGSDGKAVDEDAAERPVHTVALPAFRIDRTEVTTAAYVLFLNETRQTADADGRPYFGLAVHLPIEWVDGGWRPKPGRERFPMTNVTWHGAAAYARWAGKRLPTEAEWEKAARGSDARKFPWGATLIRANLQFGQHSIAAVGQHPAGASPHGCLDMAGNAWEWTSSLFRPYPYDPADGREDPLAPGRRVARGGSWTGEPHIATTTYRFRPEPGFAHAYLGFRCAASVE